MENQMDNEVETEVMVVSRNRDASVDPKIL